MRRWLSWVIRGERPLASHLLLSPSALWLNLCLLAPLLLLFALAFTERGSYGTIQWTRFTLDNFRRILDPDFLPVLGRTLGYTLTTTGLCLVLGYPFAYFLTFYAPGSRSVYIMLLMLPFWTSYLVGIYAWIILLGREGLLNSLLLNSGLVSEPLVILNTPFAVIMGLTYTYLPFMILPVYGSLEKLPRMYIEAAKDLGAGPFRAFLKVTLPLSLPGVLAGSILTLIPCMGDFLSAEFLGGPTTFLIGNLIQTQFGMAQDWPFGASLSAIILLLLGAGLLLHERLGEADEAELRSLT